MLPSNSIIMVLLFVIVVFIINPSCSKSSYKIVGYKNSEYEHTEKAYKKRGSKKPPLKPKTNFKFHNSSVEEPTIIKTDYASYNDIKSGMSRMLGMGQNWSAGLEETVSYMDFLANYGNKDKPKIDNW
ncbi:uncharacterized protein LOC126903137 isoform X2 [Daktulosphaira vitifoliae]|uniref:uncharacterized protein LOC126903137 isoform X2 n=1 Tax=Daktulosphaira vitifoliae TaxID=58002 RepID=UPI0021AABAC1|nr:uncharacterized protein LOC126903137 isoform X2 [Daktulosphaira vitifoliae]